ncbi:hypothetical protein SLAV_38395 [Streptomyces lavendulae subsp. lavendulae]|uniref:Uncharacterized protein n=1 Tax=Streptomyces lavendulae subsp. lavendulae TaxID=58340 RepID=A0A2K8PRS8_STRLA|nr:hypothetical protein [Streptomyces lavendulae]ATZ22129.1 hypothetical protein SLAV_00995 [Streptomyces lavendulae subsp. lavendulae]ATZ29442.1 hypothetical protein SLAV_38395 [Streptomyces lavendulae subsp. lavendulae]
MRAAILTVAGSIIVGCLGLWSGVFSGKDDRDDPKPAPSASQAGPSSGGAGPGQVLPACGGKPGLDVTVEPKQLTVASDGSLTAEVNCTLGAGLHLSWIVQIDGVGKPVPHTNYYHKDDLGRPGPYTFDVHLSQAVPGSARTIYVVLTDDFSYRQLSDNRNPDGSLLKLPNGARKVSNSVLVKRY